FALDILACPDPDAPRLACRSAAALGSAHARVAPGRGWCPSARGLSLVATETSRCLFVRYGRLDNRILVPRIQHPLPIASPMHPRRLMPAMLLGDKTTVIPGAPMRAAMQIALVLAILTTANRTWAGPSERPCCSPNGTCQILSPVDCELSGGDFP